MAETVLIDAPNDPQQTAPSTPQSNDTRPSYSWEKEINGSRYLITTDTTQLNLALFNEAFKSEDVYWTGPMPDHAVKLMVENSCVLGLYVLSPPSSEPKSNDLMEASGAPPPKMRLEANRNVKLPPKKPAAEKSGQVKKQIGFGRLITDYATLAYLTDVWISPEYQGAGLGKWMMACVREVLSDIPALRRAVLLTQPGGKGVPFYERELSMKLVEPGVGYAFMDMVPGRE